MKPCLERVLATLRKKKRIGVTFDDFHEGHSLPKRVCELKDLGYHITSRKETSTHGGLRSRYWLIKERA